MSLKRLGLEGVAIVTAALTFGYMVMRLMEAHNLSLPSGQPLFGDYIAFWAAGRGALEGHAAQLHDPTFMYPFQKTIALDARFFAPWNSPPTWLPICCVLALLPYPVSALTFAISTFVFLLLVIRKFLPDWRSLIFPATAPAVLYQFGSIQAGMLISGITGLALHWVDKRPRLAGALVGLLAIKPHLAILWPVFLALSRRWTAFVAAAVAATAFVVFAGLVFGFDSYIRFFENLERSQGLISGQRITTPAYASLFANLLGMHVPQAIAMGAHVVSAIGAVIAAGYCFLKGDRNAGGAALCAATLLISPYMFFYDYTMLLIAGALLGVPRSLFGWIVAIFAWGAGYAIALAVYQVLPICPTAAWLVLIAAIMRVRNAASAPAQEQHT